MENNSALEKANNNIITRSQWRGLNFLIAFSFFHLLCFCLYVGDWGFSKGFVTAPFLLGKYVYAIGNEYYMKHRSLHKYSLDKKEWEIIF